MTMRRNIRFIFIFISTLAVLPLLSCIQFSLKRTVPLNQPDKYKQLIAQDRERHTRLIFNDSVNFPLQGSVKTIHMYTTTVKLGTPGEEFTLQVDTGSSDLWVTSISCGESCSRSTPGRSFDPKKSSTAKIVPCSKKRDCHFNLTYGDGSESAGYYIEDVLHLNFVGHGKHKHNGSARIMFGLSTRQAGNLTTGDRPIDGIFGLGMDYTSPIAQLSSMGVAPRVFSHCLKGEGEGGGSLAIGKVFEPNMVYTPLHISQTHYKVDLLKIGVDEKIVEIDSSIFAKSTYVDCGSFLAYLPSVAYDSLFTALNAAVLKSTSSVAYDFFEHCYPVSHDGNVNKIFPSIRLYFAGDASMTLKPNQYLLNVGASDSTGAALWCLGFARSLFSIADYTLLGVMILTDKIIEYDVDRNQFGYTEFNCSLPMKVSSHYETSGGGRKSLQMTSSFKALQFSILVLSSLMVFAG